ncbi:MAG: hypothetical protein ACRDCY_18035 [Aeromonas veronii]
MPYRITGTLKLPSGVVAAGVDIKFRALKSFSPLIEQAEITVRTDAAGKYDVSLEFNAYVCEVTFSTNRPFNAGQFTVAVDTVAGQDLPTLLQQGGWTPATPEWIVQIQNWLAAANASATSADASAKAAKVSETNAKGSEASVESDRAEVAANTTEVTTKHADVVAKASQVATDAAATQSAKTTAVQAADTASQKAASAAAHDASAQDSATRAENAASVMVGAVLDGGECDLSGGAYPQPVEVAGKKYSTIWYVAIAGQVSGTSYDVGDLLRYTTAKTGYYFKVDAKDEVYSVNGEKGAVTVTPEKIGAEKTGIAQQLVEQHASKVEAHQIAGVQGLPEALAGKEPLGTAASAITAHEAKVGAHPVSGISGLAALIDTISPPLGVSEWDRLRTNVRAGHVPSDGQILKRTDYPDMWAAIAAGKVPVIPDADWLADPYKRASFTPGDGSTTFRVPDENGKYAGSLGALFQRGDGLNSAGTNGYIQGDAIRNIKGDSTLNGFHVLGLLTENIPGSPVFIKQTGTTRNYISQATSDVWGNAVSFDASRAVPTAADNHPVSATGCWVVKVIKSSKVAGL